MEAFSTLTYVYNGNIFRGRSASADLPTQTRLEEQIYLYQENV
jgi:hypothetical protein